MKNRKFQIHFHFSSKMNHFTHSFHEINFNKNKNNIALFSKAPWITVIELFV